MVAVIEFAIFVNMGIPYYTGTVIPFISSVVIGTIQLGATVDYAILMTTRYLSERNAGHDKKRSDSYYADYLYEISNCQCTQLSLRQHSEWDLSQVSI
ncbi:MMPL family transporter [Butyrivibrio sp. AE3003]|uniref:MMPL family transporter n=1 Tax=Butyrivibrio sp. AE3003 TaxID=1496721 RepID=UPI002FE54F92